MSSSRTILAALLAAVLAFLSAPLAGAHGGSAIFDVLEAKAVDGRIVELRVAVTYSADRERAEEALVEAVGHGPNGRTTEKLTLTRLAGGVYRLHTAVDTTGTWRFDVVSRFPPGSIAIRVHVTDDEGGTARPWWVAVAAMVVAVAVAAGLTRRRRRRAAPAAE